MKKLFTLILMALAIVTGAKAQGTQLILGGQGENEENSWGWNRPISTDETIYFDKTWGEFWLAQNLNGAKKYRLTVKETNSKINLRINNSETTEGNDKNQYKAITSKVMEGELTSTDTGIELQATEAGQIIHVVSFVLIDESGKEEQTSYATNWGTLFVDGQYTSTGQWAELYMKSVAGRETQQIQINFGEAVESGKLHLKAYYTDDTEGYFDISGTTAKITLEKAVKAVSLQAKTTDAVIVKINSVYTYEIPSFSAVTLSSTLSGTNENIPVVANGEELFDDLSDEATNDFVINSITITPVGSFQYVQGKLRLTSEDGNTQIEPKSGGFYTVPFTYDSTDDVWKAENLNIKLAGGDLDLDANTNYILEFYFEGSTDGSMYDYTYKNGENNFKVKFQNGTPAVQFKDTETATMTLNVDGTATTINFNKDGSVYNNGNDDLGEVSMLGITGFTTTVTSSVAASSNLQCWITTADGSASTQEHGAMYTENVTTSGDEQSFTWTGTTDIISYVESQIGLTDGETYILHGYFQVKDNDGNYYFAPNKDNDESFAIQFTYKAPAFTGASINLTTGDTAEDITLTDNMTEAVSYENVEKFIINSVSATTVGSVSNATLYYYIYTDDTWDNQVRTLPLTNDGSGNWTATMNQDFVQAFGWTSGHAYAINFYFLGDDGNGGTVAWNNSNNEYWVNITVKDSTTGINTIEGDEADAKADAYNIAGQKVGKNYKGLVIKNGKKTVVK